MLPLIVLVVSIAVFRLAGLAGVSIFQDSGFVLRAGLAVMFLLTASAHWGKRRGDLVRMVPRALPRPDLLVTFTGMAEIAGAAGLLAPQTKRAACLALIVLLVCLFPANVRAAREKLTIAGRPVQGVPVRLAIQLIFISVLVAAARIR